MMISGISSNVSINAVRESSGLSNIIANADISTKESADSPAVIVDVSERARLATLEAKDANNDSGDSLNSDTSEKGSADSPAVILDISERAKQAALEIKDENDNDGSLDIDEDVLKDFAEGMTQEAIDFLEGQTPDPFEDIETMGKFEYAFDENSPESTINDILEGKAINASVVTSELSNMLRQTVTNSDASVKERAENRETALKCAEYIADKYLDDPDEAKEFMAAINDIYEEDVYTDKGYTEIDTDTGSVWVRKGSTLTSLTGDGTVISPNYAWGAYLDAYCEANGISKIKAADVGDIFKEFISTSSETKEKLEAEGRKAFVQNENHVTEAIENAKLNFNYSLFNNSIARLLKAF